MHPVTGDEYALARKEISTGKGYADFYFDFSPDVTLEEDLFRRDFTINSMAMDDSGKIIDPYGGISDLKNKIIRHTSDAFIDDPVRVLRAARLLTQYSHLGFKVAPETMSLISSIKPLLTSLTPERIWKETARAISEKVPSTYFYLLRDTGVLSSIFPEIDCLFGVPQPEIHHPEIDTGVHTMMVLDQAALLSEKLSIRVAALLHDLGKGVTDKELLPRHLGHEAAGVPIIEEFCRRLKAPKKIRELSVMVGLHHLNCHRSIELRPITLLNLFQDINAFKDKSNLIDFIIACEADSKGRLGFEKRSYPQANYLLRCFDAANRVSGKMFYDKGVRGFAIKERVLQERVLEIKKEISKINNNSLNMQF